MLKIPVLDATTKSIQAVLAGAVTTTQPDFVSSYADVDSTSFIEGENDGTLNSTTPVTLVAAPAASTRRLVKDISIFNRDTVAVTVTISYNNNGTLRSIFRASIPTNGWMTSEGVYSATGALITAFSAHNHQSDAAGGTLDAAAIASGTLDNARINWSAPSTIGSFSPPNMTVNGLVVTSGGEVDANLGKMRLPSASLPATAGYVRYDATRNGINLYDGYRIKQVTPASYATIAFPVGHVLNNAFAVTFNMANQYDVTLIPMWVPTPMTLHSVRVRNGDTANLRNWYWALYSERGNGSASLDLVANATANQTFTPTVASDREIACTATELAAGIYWLGIQNLSASFGFSLAAKLTDTFTYNAVRRLAAGTGAQLGSSLSPSGGSWAASTSQAAAMLIGRVLGEATAWT